MPKSYDNFDRSYRKGLVLGLSLAEIFLILLFLLLLVATGIVQKYEKEIRKQKEVTQDLTKKLEAIEKIINIGGKPITREEFEDLIEAAQNREELLEQIEELNAQLDNLIPISERMEKIDKAIQSKNIEEKKAQEIRETIAGIIEESKNENEIINKLDVAEGFKDNDEVQILAQKLAKTLEDKKVSDETKKKIMEILNEEAEKNEAEPLLAKLKKAFDEDNYQNPCWFVDQPNNTKKRKKEVKIFRIRMNDAYLDIMPSSLQKYQNNPRLDLGVKGVIPNSKINGSKTLYIFFSVEVFAIKFNNKGLQKKRALKPKI